MLVCVCFLFCFLIGKRLSFLLTGFFALFKNAFFCLSITYLEIGGYGRQSNVFTILIFARRRCVFNRLSRSFKQNLSILMM